MSHSTEVKFILITRLDMKLCNCSDKCKTISLAQRSFLEGYYQDKIQSAIAQAVYLDPGMKHSHEQAKSLGKMLVWFDFFHEQARVNIILGGFDISRLC